MYLSGKRAQRRRSFQFFFALKFKATTLTQREENKLHMIVSQFVFFSPLTFQHLTARKTKRHVAASASMSIRAKHKRGFKLQTPALKNLCHSLFGGFGVLLG